MAVPDEHLRALLGTEPPASIGNLSPDAQAALAEILRDARERQSRALEESFRGTLKHVPFPVRGVVKKILIG